jgi:beta-phosphoglucomutase-like phosphatase (HAD superfamily)
MSLLQALIFDVDGTLADTEETHRRAFNRAFFEAGLDWEWTPELYADLLTISGGRERIRNYGHDCHVRLSAPEAWADFVAEVHASKTRHYGEMLRAGELPLRPGIARLIVEARRAGLVLGIATSSTYGNLEALLDQNLPSDWRHWFTAVESCDSVPQKKPSPAVYDAVLKRIGIAPSSCVAFEDTENGLRAASAAGIMTVVATHAFTRNHDFAGAALVVDHLGEPDLPFEVLAGDARGRDYVTLGLLEALIETRILRIHNAQHSAAA